MNKMEQDALLTQDSVAVVVVVEAEEEVHTDICLPNKVMVVIHKM